MTRTNFSRGNIILLALVFAGIFVTVSTALVGQLTSYGRSERASVMTTQALAIAEGALEQAAAKLNQNPSYTGETDTALGEGTFTIAVSSIDSTTKRVVVTGYVPNRTSPKATKTISANVGVNDAVISFRYGIQAGQGGFYLANSSSVNGNVHSSGKIIGTSANYIYGDVVSAGPGGHIYGIHATGSAYAHTVGKDDEITIIDKNAYYTVKEDDTTVKGISYPGSPDQPIAPLPISDAQIADWEAQAEAGGIATCSGGTYSISSGSVTLGPKKIPCNLVISNSAIVTVAGHLWVTGNITIQNSAQIRMHPSLGATNVAIIADNPADQINSSRVMVKNSASFQNSGTTGSFVFLISQNRSAEMGGSVNAIELSNSASALVAYAAHGLIPLANSISLKEVTAYKITMQNSATVTYDTGLPSAVFESGPGGSWGFVPGTYAVK